MNTAIKAAAGEAQRAGAHRLLTECGCLKPAEKMTVVCDKTTRAVAHLVVGCAEALGAEVTSVETAPLSVHGQEPPATVADAMLGADLVLGLTAKSMAHTVARRSASDQGARYLSLPEYTLDLLADPSLQTDFREGGRRAQRIADLFTAGSRVRVTTLAGTDIGLDITGRVGNCCPGYVAAPGELGSPPDIEANVSPVETVSEGTVVVDGSIPYPSLGLLVRPLVLRVKGGRVIHMEGDADTVERLEQLFASADPRKTRVLAECGVGLNPRARLTGVMLTDEGAFGTMHFGFGSNATVGGTNDVAFHLDFVFRNATMTVDGTPVLAAGEFVA